MRKAAVIAGNFLKKNIVFCIAVTAAVVTMFFVPIDSQYIQYFDFKILACIFCVLAVVNGLHHIHFFEIISKKIIQRFHTVKMAALALIYLTFVASMIIANDLALITFLPLGYYLLKNSDNLKWMAFTFIMQTIAANLGGMLTPFGNPQNLYLYGKFQIPDLEFISTMFLPFLYSIILITITCLIFVKSTPMKLTQANPEKLNGKKTALMMGLLVISILIVFHGIPYYIGLLAVIGVLGFADRKALLEVDYLLLFTFCAFFVFAGNMARIPEVRDFFGYLVQQNTFLYGILTCQFISNVPSALLLSNFVTDYKELLYAVNIGGIGTLISSLASLITFREYVKHEPKKGLRYLGLFTVINVLFLGILIVLVMFAT